MSDFIIIGVLLIGGGLAFEFISSKLDTKYRPVVALITLGFVMLVWVELAVGIFGSPFAGS